jgi:glutamyl-tRNA reductase
MAVGVNHRSSSLALRDRLFVEDHALPGYLERLRQAGVGQAIVLSTCDRVEVQAVADDLATAARRIKETMAAHGGVAPGDLDGQAYVLADEDAVRHIFAVASSLDSLVIGEPQVLGQVKASHRLSRELGMVGAELEAVLQAAYGTAKRVRSETAIGERPVSIAAAAQQIARDLHGDLGRCSALLIGGGDMGELIAREMKAAGLGHLAVTHPNDARADAAARQLSCHAALFAALGDRLAEADIVVSSLGARRHTIAAAMVQDALRRRRRKPIFLIDAAVPGDIEPAVERIDGAFLYDLGDLERVAMEGRASRESAAALAQTILDAEVDAFFRARAERAAVPALVRLRQHFEAARAQALADAAGDADKATRLLINRLLHDPSQALRELATEAPAEGTAEAQGDGVDLAAAEKALQRLFRLGRDGGASDDKEDGP